MTPKRLTNFMIDPELAEGLKTVKQRDGISEGEQIRRGVRMWLESKGVMKSDRKPRGKRSSRS